MNYIVILIVLMYISITQAMETETNKLRHDQKELPLSIVDLEHDCKIDTARIISFNIYQLSQSDIQQAQKLLAQHGNALYFGFAQKKHTSEVHDVLRLMPLSLTQQLTRLWLWYNDLKTIPWNRFTSLELLEANDNSLHDLTGIGSLTRLRELNLHGNSVKLLPPDIAQLSALQILHLDFNQIEVLPQETGQLSNLTELWLNNNKLKTIPPCIKGLVKVKFMVLEYNQLQSLCDEIGCLHELTSLLLGRNQLTNLPRLQQLTSLKRLELHNNKLETIPEEIGLMTQLCTLSIIGNPITAVPQSIINLKKNNLLSLF